MYEISREIRCVIAFEQMGIVCTKCTFWSKKKVLRILLCLLPPHSFWVFLVVFVCVFFIPIHYILLLLYWDVAHFLRAKPREISVFFGEQPLLSCKQEKNYIDFFWVAFLLPLSGSSINLFSVFISKRANRLLTLIEYRNGTDTG